VTTVPPPPHVARFPFPFPTDTYRYSTNLQPAARPLRTAAGSWGEDVLDLDGGYEAEARLCEQVLDRDPGRCQELPHMRPASWDALLFLLRELAQVDPEHMRLDRAGDRYHWVNRRLGIERDFVIGDDATLPEGPLRFVGPQVQDDLVLLDQRDGALWADAGLVTFAADWSMRFDVGMSFLEVHGPVPRIHPERIISRAQQFLMRLKLGEAYRRTNWTMTVDRRLDTSTETYPEWGPDRRKVLTEGDLGERLHLRTEVQHLLRLPLTGTVLFLIRTYLISFADIATVPQWRARTAAVLAELPDDMADYKGLTRYRAAAVEWLRAA
jgi:hypothetical protein